MKISPADIEELIDAAIDYGENNAIHAEICDRLCDSRDRLSALKEMFFVKLNPDQVN